MTLSESVAEQLAWQRNRDEPNEKERQQAVGMVQEWNNRRAAVGLPPLREDYDPIIAGSIVVSDDSDCVDDEGETE